ncbi:hypothetical protein FACS1894168_3780 [Deltaproteobacteria bacterium]|nr:hypothetical protein FACS1894168_3780 [Deltaproteobacteria bacterium]
MLRDLILRFKNSRELSLSRLLGSFFVNHPAITGPYDAVVPIPLHPKRLRDRGFNQAVELAKILAAHLDTRLLSGGIARSVDTHPQAGLSRQERSRNVLGIFTASPEAAEKKLLLVDDVATTCATVRSATLALLDAGASSVDIAVLARTPGDSSLI